MLSKESLQGQLASIINQIERFEWNKELEILLEEKRKLEEILSNKD